jgi:hypothetical protein
MALSIRQKFVETCLNIGREVETNVIARVKSDAGPIEDKELTKIFKPIIDNVEVRIRQEIAEVEAEAVEKEEELENDKLASAIRSELYNNAVLFVNGKRKKVMPIHQAKRLRNELNETLRSEFAGIEKNYHIPEEIIDNLEDDFIHRYPPDSQYWEKYCPTLKITVKEPADKLISARIPALVQYVEETKATFNALEDVATLVERLGAVMWTEGSIAATVSVLRQMDPLWKQENISRDELYVFLCTMEKLDAGSCKDFLGLFMMFLEQQRRHRLSLETEAAKPVAEPPTAVKRTGVVGTCAAYDCFGNTYAKDPECIIENCHAILCTECSEMDRVCENHGH